MGEVRGTKTPGYIAQISGTVVGAGNTRQMLDILSFHPSDSEWKLRGNCASRDIDPEMFTSGSSVEENRSKFRIALEVCKGCPVTALCDDEFSDEEKKFHVHGGKPPVGFKMDVREKFLHEETGIWRFRHCPNGHDKLSTGYTTNGQCLVCKRETMNKKNARKREDRATMAA